jgi:hypothetical protein
MMMTTTNKQGTEKICGETERTGPGAQQRATRAGAGDTNCNPWRSASSHHQRVHGSGGEGAARPPPGQCALGSHPYPICMCAGVQRKIWPQG